MQEGIGRGGYRILAIVFYVLAALGIAGIVYALGRKTPDGFNPAMTILASAATTVLFVMLLMLLRKSKVPDESKPAATFTPGPPIAIAPQRQINFEFHVEDDGAEADAEAEPPATIRPFGRDLPEVPKRAEPRLPPNRNLEMDTKGWPKRKAPTGITRGEMKVIRENEKVQEKVARMDEDAGEALVLPLQPKPQMRITQPARDPLAAFDAQQAKPKASKPAMTISKADVVEAKLAFPNTTVPRGMARGKCGSCNAGLYAPTKRPIHLRCPSCGKVTSLS
jgi:hypothetical protein